MKITKPEHLSKKLGFLALFLSGPLFLAASDPSNLPLPLLLVPFVWLFVALFATGFWIARKGFARNSLRRAVIAAVITSTLPVLLLVFQSIHQLSLKDILISVGLIVVASFYMSRADFIK